MHRVLVLSAVLVALLPVPAARAWTWPASGDVLQPFVFDQSSPYAAGQHRGIDVGAAAGEAVRAPAAGSVTFAGVVPGSGESVTIATADGLAITLTHLGSISASAGATLAEGATVGTVGPSGEPEVAGPYVHLGIRTAADPQGYIDPLAYLPVRANAAPSPAPARSEPVPPPSPAPVAQAAPSPAAAAPAPTAQPADPVAPAPAAPPRAVVDAPAAGGVDVAAPAPRARGLTVRSSSAPRRPVQAPRPVVVSSPAGGVRPRAAPATLPVGARPGPIRIATRGTIDVPVAAADARRQSGPEPAPDRVLQPQPPRLAVTAPARAPAAETRQPRRKSVPLVAVLLALSLLACAAVCRKAARIIGARGDGRQETYPRGAGVALCRGLPAPGACGGIRAVRRLRALSPAEGQRRARGQRDGRARDAGHGRRRQGGQVVP
jgi:hypothetical protein